MHDGFGLYEYVIAYNNMRIKVVAKDICDAYTRVCVWAKACLSIAPIWEGRYSIHGFTPLPFYETLMG